MEITSINSRLDVYKYIASSSIYGNLGLFIGAGLPMAVLNSPRKRIALSWKELILNCAIELGIDYDKIDKEGSSYPEIASKVSYKYAQSKKIDPKEATKKLKETIANNTSLYPDAEVRDEYQKYLHIIDPKWIITTNYDTVIESILAGKGYSLGPFDQLVAPQEFIPVYHLHGVRTDPDSIIITQEDYTQLFRPNQYRQQKLPLILKESVTVLLGYNLGDFNVLTAVDWSKNVYKVATMNYPHDIIQFYFTSSPNLLPYRDHNGIVIVEFDNLAELLKELSMVVEAELTEHEQGKKVWVDIHQILTEPTNNAATRFIDEEPFRKEVLSLLKGNTNYVISGFLECFSKAMSIIWDRAAPSGAFHAYNEGVTFLLDILIEIEIKSMSPALIASVAYQLNDIAYYIGPSIGQSKAAYKTWSNRKAELALETTKELENIAKLKGYDNLYTLITTGKT